MYLRPAVLDDALDLLQWKNDYETCKNSLVSESIIYWTNHLGWLERRLKEPGFYIIMDGDTKCGDLRFDIGEDTEVSIRIAPKLRGRKIATQALALGLTLHNQRLYAKIVVGNTASYKLFTAAGFTPVGVGEQNGKKYHLLRY
jgi:RimJ/RimL family protein N-acetyltransferase